MKIRLHLILIVACVVFPRASQVFAQDGSLQDYEVSDPERDRLEREKIIYSPGEGEIRYIPKNPVTQPSDGVTTTASRDTTAARQVQIVAAPPKAGPEQATKPPEKPMMPREDESILSFNFLYYIIQKYKLQDIID